MGDSSRPAMIQVSLSSSSEVVVGRSSHIQLTPWAVRHLTRRQCEIREIGGNEERLLDELKQ